MAQLTHNGLPVYNITIEDSDDMLLCISLVDAPAVGKAFITFNEEKPKRLMFASEDGDRHIVTGVAILADTMIYRCGEDGSGYYVVFTPEVIRQLVEGYNRNGYQNVVSLQHSGRTVDDVIMIESYFVDKARGICPAEFSEVPDGSWCCSYLINNDQLWDAVKNGDELNGFSIEVTSTLQPAPATAEPEPDPYEADPDLFDEFMNWVEDDYAVKKKNDFKETTRGDVRKVIEGNRQVNITVGEKTLEDQQIFQLGKDEAGADIAVVYNPANKSWYVQKITDIKALEVTENELVNYVFNASYKNIMNNLDITITDSSVGAKTGATFDDTINRNQLVMISYFDEEPGAATGFRTCLVTSLGYTQKKNGSGNEAIRVYEYSGASRTGLEGGTEDWRLLLTRRITAFKPVDYMDPITTAPAGYNGEAQAGSGKNGTMSIVTNTMQFPPKEAWEPTKIK